LHHHHPVISTNVATLAASALFAADWLATLKSRAHQAPLRTRVALFAAGQQVGTVVNGLLDGFLNESSCGVSQNVRNQLLKEEQIENGSRFVAWHLQGAATASLNQIALALRDAPPGHAAHGHVAKYWRGEQLGVYGTSGDLLGSVERGAVRPLGIATRAVHLVGQTPAGHMWVQQRAHDKANDPGLWDTLMGGMISVQDDLHTALERETAEEAGLAMAQLRDVALRGRVNLQRPADNTGVGYVVEDIDWFSCTVPEGVVPVNQDGEVAQFQLLERAELVARLQRDEFTLEASLILAAALGQDLETTKP
jgi:8-oxo-dGTP pyrophosphatase MutT (NUDIX family)